MIWKLTVSYLGATSSETVPVGELADLWTFVDMSEDVDKCGGGHFEDEDGPTENPLTWKDGKARETRCGPWMGGFDDSTVAYCNELLTRAGLALLVRAETLDATFDFYGLNANALNALDRAEWTLEALPDVIDSDIE